MTTVAALLSWYDETPELLARMIRSAAAAGCDRLAAVDGAYAQFPDAKPRSPEPQLRAIQAAARSNGLHLAVYQPDDLWPSEMAKRTMLFRLADAIGPPGGWKLVIDADCRVETKGWKLGELLDFYEERDGPHDVANAAMWTPPTAVRLVAHPPEHSTIRCLFRGDGISVVGNHFTYVDATGRLLWGHEPTQTLAPAHDLTGAVTLEHLNRDRPRSRVERQFAYYVERDETGVERGPCHRCGKPSVCFFAGDLRDEPDGVSVSWVELCAACVRGQAAENHERARQLGIDPADVTRPLSAVRGAFA